jgi:hypothetical protein
MHDYIKKTEKLNIVIHQRIQLQKKNNKIKKSLIKRRFELI